MADAFGAFAKPSLDKYVSGTQIQKLTDIDENFEFAYITKESYPSTEPKDNSSIVKEMYKITDFAYYSGSANQTAIWHNAKQADGTPAGQWTVVAGKHLTGDKGLDASKAVPGSYSAKTSDNTDGQTGN